METRELMDIALKAGEILLTSGAEIYRVEDTIIRICRCYNVECESFALPTGIFISTHGKDRDSISLMRRIKDRRVDLCRIEQINRFSRNLENKTVPYEEALGILENIENTKGYGFSTRLISAGVAALIFTLLFKGDIAEGMTALIITMLIYTAKEKIGEIGFFQFFEFFAAGIIAGAAALLAAIMMPGLSLYRIIIGSIMILLPGVAITNGIKDALYGDLVSSIARLGEAVFIVSAVGVGVGIVLSVGLRWM